MEFVEFLPRNCKQQVDEKDKVWVEGIRQKIEELGYKVKWIRQEGENLYWECGWEKGDVSLHSEKVERRELNIKEMSLLLEK